MKARKNLRATPPAKRRSGAGQKSPKRQQAGPAKDLLIHRPGGKGRAAKTDSKHLPRPGDGESPSPKASSPKSTEATPLGGKFPVVGIGASAGGLEAFTELLHHLPTNTGMAFIVVQHLSPGHESILPQLLARTTAMPVYEVTNEMRVEPNKVYVIPANASMSIADGTLKLGPHEHLRGKLRAIDFFLDSLARERGSRAIGVILSGTDFDATAGLGAIKAEGGITFA